MLRLSYCVNACGHYNSIRGQVNCEEEEEEVSSSAGKCFNMLTVAYNNRKMLISYALYTIRESVVGHRVRVVELYRCVRIFPSQLKLRYSKVRARVRIASQQRVMNINACQPEHRRGACLGRFFRPLPPPPFQLLPDALGRNIRRYYCFIVVSLYVITILLSPVTHGRACDII